MFVLIGQGIVRLTRKKVDPSPAAMDLKSFFDHEFDASSRPNNLDPVMRQVSARERPCGAQLARYAVFGHRLARGD